MFRICKVTANSTVDFAAEELKKYLRMMMPEAGEILISYAPDAKDGFRLGLMPAFYQGLFLSPTVVAGALKGAIFAANIYEKLGFSCVPNATESRHDIIQAVELGSEAAMIAFCKGIQAAAPVDSYADPIPGDMPGYDAQVIMAAGAFVQGSTMELSADGPIREPYAVYFQGGLTWAHAKLGILMSLQKLVDAGLVSL
jgi:cystathionine beta-lyase family protein involved in aluminum resistance